MMQTTAPARQTATTTTRQPRQPRRVLHMFHRDGLAFARQSGLQAKALCGRWITPGRTDDADREQASRGPGQVCRACRNILGAPQDDST